MATIKTLASVAPAELYQAHQAAFAGYARSWTKIELERMLQRRGYVPELSFGAFGADGQLLSFTMNGIGHFNGMPTAYDLSTGTLEAFRGQGLASRIFEHMTPALVAAGIRQYLLEVLQNNTTAVEIYQRQGFRISRELSYFIQGNPAEYLMQPSAYHVLQVIPIPPAETVRHMWDFEPAWQNNLEAIGRAPEHFEAFGVFVSGMLAGYAIIELGAGDIPQIAVAPSFRRRGIGSALLQGLMSRSAGAGARIINVDTHCTSLPAFLERHGLPKGGMQYEMTKTL